MLTENRKYNFIGELTLKRSRVLENGSRPKDDKVNWLFLNTGERQFSFVYKIDSPLKANYEEPFKVDLSFTMIEVVKDNIELNCEYEILRGQESIGTLKLITVIEY
jgi:hypothetical protein